MLLSNLLFLKYFYILLYSIYQKKKVLFACPYTHQFQMYHYELDCNTLHIIPSVDFPLISLFSCICNHVSLLRIYFCLSFFCL